MDAAEFAQRKTQQQKKPDDGEWYRMAHVLTKALYSTKELRPHLALILYVVHNTWGAMGKKSFIFSASSASRATGIARPNVIRTRNLLVQANVLLKFDKEGLELGVNKYPEAWDLSILKDRHPVSGGDTPLYPTDTPPVSHRYTPCIPQIQAGGLESANDAHPGGHIDSYIDKDIDNPPNPPEGGKRRRSIPELHRFDEFWSAYPKKSTKAQCVDWWKRQKPDDGLIDQILSALEAYKDSRDVKRGFILDPIRFLKYKRWEDEALQAPDDDFWSADRFKRGSQ